MSADAPETTSPLHPNCTLHCREAECVERQRDKLREAYAQVAHENFTLRSILAASAEPCLYCGKAKIDMGKCSEGLLVCPRVSDLPDKDEVRQ